jgi:hypothetical protein
MEHKAGLRLSRLFATLASINFENASFGKRTGAAMLFRPKRIVHATTEQEIDAALETADQVIVEGDDRLLSYAVNQAAADPLSTIEVESGQQTISIDVKPEQRRSEWRRGATILFGLSLVISLLGLGAAYLLTRTADEAEDHVILESSNRPPPPQLPPPASPPRPVGSENPRSPLPGPSAPEKPPSGAPTPGPTTTGPQPPSPDPRPSDTLTLVQMLIWPVVTLAAILALFLIARQSIGSGRNVELTWKVTEKVQGKVVISKTQKRAPVRPRPVAS